MSTVNLMILGFLKRKELNAYEIVKIIEEYKINNWIKMPAPSVYQTLKKMMKEGYLSGVIRKDGEMPEKTIYSITEKGEELFLKLMEKYSSCPDRAYENFLPFISNLVYMDRGDGNEMLEKLKERFDAEKGEIDFFKNRLSSGSSLYEKSIINFYDKVLTAKQEWLNDLADEYRVKGYGGPDE